MRYSQTLIPTIKEVPADAEIISHQLMLRAGLMRKLASGTYIYLPAGQRMLNKVMQIVREEMDRTGAQEITMPVDAADGVVGKDRPGCGLRRNAGQVY